MSQISKKNNNNKKSQISKPEIINKSWKTSLISNSAHNFRLGQEGTSGFREQWWWPDSTSPLQPLKTTIKSIRKTNK